MDRQRATANTSIRDGMTSPARLVREPVPRIGRYPALDAHDLEVRRQVVHPQVTDGAVDTGDHAAKQIDRLHAFRRSRLTADLAIDPIRADLIGRKPQKGAFETESVLGFARLVQRDELGAVGRPGLLAEIE